MIRSDGLRYAKSVYDMLFDEVYHILNHDILRWYSFDPLSEVACGY